MPRSVVAARRVATAGDLGNDLYLLQRRVQPRTAETYRKASAEFESWAARMGLPAVVQADLDATMTK